MTTPEGLHMLKPIPRCQHTPKPHIKPSDMCLYFLRTCTWLSNGIGTSLCFTVVHVSTWPLFSLGPTTTETLPLAPVGLNLGTALPSFQQLSAHKNRSQEERGN